MGLRTRRRLKGSTTTSTVLMHFARSTPRLVIALSPIFFGSYSKAISAPCRKAENWCSNSVTPTSHTSFTLTETQIIHKHETFFFNCPALCLILSYFGKVTEPNFAAVSHRSNVTDIHTYYKKKIAGAGLFWHVSVLKNTAPSGFTDGSLLSLWLKKISPFLCTNYMNSILLTEIYSITAFPAFSLRQGSFPFFSNPKARPFSEIPKYKSFTYI